MDPFLTPGEAQDMLRIAESFGSFGTYAEEATSAGLGESLPQRFDVGLNYVARGLDGSGNPDQESTAMSRTNYFRETYAYGEDKKVAGIEPFMAHPQMLAAAREFSACDNLVPAIVYANLLVPGQELAIHTDVPEFRGANRKNVPQWLLVCMLHSGLFDAWRIPILTCVSWFGAAQGGAFTFYPQGPGRRRQAISAKHNSAILIDTDRVFHGVERVDNDLPDLPEIGPGSRLYFLGDDQWQLRSEQITLAEFTWPQIRYSISWKGYCFRDQNERDAWETHSDDLSLEQILDVFEKELKLRGVISGARPSADRFAQLMVETFIQFPGQEASQCASNE
jgi:hypothetical protein